MAFMTLKTIVFQKKTLFNFVCFVCLLPSLVNYTPDMTFLLSRKGVKGIVSTKSNVSEEFVMTLLASTPFFHKINVNNFLFLSHFTLFLQTQDIFWIIPDLHLVGFLWNKERTYLMVSCCNYWLSCLWK